MDRWQSEIDRELEKLMREHRGEVLPGTGKPLDLSQDSMIPSDQRMAFKIMKDHDIAPEWMTQGKELDTQEATIRQQLKKAVQEYRLGLSAAKTEALRLNVEAVWSSAQRTLSQKVATFNDRVLTHNLKLPPGIGHRRILRYNVELERALAETT